jgi:hypothetical protein
MAGTVTGTGVGAGSTTSKTSSGCWGCTVCFGSSRTTGAIEEDEENEEDGVTVNKDWVETLEGTPGVVDVRAWAPCEEITFGGGLPSSKAKLDSTEFQERKSRKATRRKPTPRAIIRAGWMNPELYEQRLISEAWKWVLR